MPQLTVQDYLRVFRQKKWLIAGTVLTCLALAGAIFLYLPKSYRSSTLIVVETQKVPESYVKGVVSQAPQDRLATIQQMILSRTLLGAVIDELKLSSSERNIDEVIEGIRRSVKVSTNREQAFVVSFAHPSPAIAQKVTARLAELFIGQNIKARESLVQEATRFIEIELGNAQAELETKEKAISEFKLLHMGELPGQVEANLRTLDRLQADMMTTNETVGRLSERLGQIEKSIREFETGEPVSTFSPSGAVLALGIQKSPVSPRKLRIREVEKDLGVLSGIYKETYPDIVHLRQELARLKSHPIEEDEINGAEQEITASGKTSEKAVGPKIVDPFYKELLRQRAEMKLDLNSLRERQNRIGTEKKLYEFRVERAPMREQQLSSLMRDHENMQKNYQALMEKRLNARISENLEKRQQGEQFRIIDPANLPESPESPDLMKIMMIGLVAGCGLGFGSAICLESIRVGFRHGEEVERLLGLPILAEVPAFQTAFGGSYPTLSFGGNPATRTSISVPHTLLPGWNKTRGNSVGKVKRESSVVEQKNGTPDWNLVMKWRPLSAVAEQYRVAATRLVLMSTERKSTVVVVTSSVKGEGKTATALNVGYALAHDLGKRTLMIDCDFKQPRLNVYAGVSADPGLSAVLQEIGSSIESCIHQIDESSLWILPAGSISARPVELFKIKKLEALLTELRERFDFIILDAPPILPLADMNVFASMGDILALVIRSGETRTDIVQKALKALRPTSQTGIILTGIQANETPYYMRGEHYAVPNNPKR